MSRSQPTATNPATRFFQWKGGEGKLEFYDKEQAKRINVPLPFEFLVLDELATITGFCEPDESGYWSNEVRSVAKEELTVRTAKGTKQVGLYKDLADVRSKGAKYAKSIYIVYKTKEGYEIGNIKASGAALTAWIEFGNKYVVQNGKVTLTGAEEAKKGTNTYWTPVFEYSSATKEEDAEAINLDVDLQVYLSQYLAARPETARHEDDAIDPDLGKATEEEILDYEARKAAKHKLNDEDDAAVTAYQDDVVNGFEDGAEVNLDEIPF